jgi:hypothetical protein
MKSPSLHAAVLSFIWFFLRLEEGKKERSNDELMTSTTAS